MAHLLTLGLICLAAWLVLALPLGIAIGRRLRQTTTSTPGGTR